MLLKQSGAVRVVGLGVASALAPAGHQDTFDDLQAYERLDVESLGKLLYACLVSRWPGAHIDQLRAAPTEHGRLLRPRQVRAGVSRKLDAVCDRILGDPPAHHRPRLTTADDIARALHLVGDESISRRPGALTRVSPDLLRLDPVVVPEGPRRVSRRRVAGPRRTSRRRPRRSSAAWPGPSTPPRATGAMCSRVSPSPCSSRRSSATRQPDHRRRRRARSAGPTSAVQPCRSRRSTTSTRRARTRREPGQVGRVVDGDVSTGWRTTTYFGQAALGGLKAGVGVVLDLGGPRELSSVRIRLAGGPPTCRCTRPRRAQTSHARLKGLRRIATLDAAGPDASVSLPTGLLTRYVVVWLTELPEVEPDSFRGEIREITVEGRA